MLSDFKNRDIDDPWDYKHTFIQIYLDCKSGALVINVPRMKYYMLLPLDDLATAWDYIMSIIESVLLQLSKIDDITSVWLIAIHTKSFRKACLDKCLDTSY